MPDEMTSTDFDTLSPYNRYKMMASLIVPRPIALVTTIDPDGTVNAAPFSMFAMVGEDPPLVMISVNRLGDGAQKDTAANIDATGEFVVHMTDAGIGARMHASSFAYPSDVDETVEVGFSTSPSQRVSPPRITEAPVAFECQLEQRLEIPSRQIYLGRILIMHATSGLIDTDAWRVRLQDYHPIARFGASFYTTTTERFSLAATNGNPVRATEIDEY